MAIPIRLTFVAIWADALSLEAYGRSVEEGKLPTLSL